MPLVKTYVEGSAIFPGSPLTVLEIACDHIVPATYSTDAHPVTPGSIIWTPPVCDCKSLMIDVFVETEGYYFRDRAEIMDERRAPMMLDAFHELFPGITFAVWPKLVHAGWAADYEDDKFYGDLSMPAAIERAKEAIRRARLHISYEP